MTHVNGETAERSDASTERSLQTEDAGAQPSSSGHQNRLETLSTSRELQDLLRRYPLLRQKLRAVYRLTVEPEPDQEDGISSSRGGRSRGGNGEEGEVKDEALGQRNEEGERHWRPSAGRSRRITKAKG